MNSRESRSRHSKHKSWHRSSRGRSSSSSSSSTSSSSTSSSTSSSSSHCKSSQLRKNHIKAARRSRKPGRQQRSLSRSSSSSPPLSRKKQKHSKVSKAVLKEKTRSDLVAAKHGQGSQTSSVKPDTETVSQLEFGSFVQNAFVSSSNRTLTDAAKISDTGKIDALHDTAIFGGKQASVDAKVSSRISTRSDPSQHSSLCIDSSLQEKPSVLWDEAVLGDESARMSHWVQFLTAYRQKFDAGDKLPPDRLSAVASCSNK